MVTDNFGTIWLCRAAPNVAGSQYCVKGRSRSIGWHHGHFYCLAPKIGTIRSDGDVKLFKDVDVKTQWAMAMYVREKLSGKSAKQLFLRSGFQVQEY